MSISYRIPLTMSGVFVLVCAIIACLKGYRVQFVTWKSVMLNGTATTRTATTILVMTKFRVTVSLESRS